MAVLDIQKLTAQPSVYAPNTLYLIGPTNSPNELQIALSSNDGSIIRRTITRAEVQNLINSNISSGGNTPIATVIKSLSPITPEGYLKCNGAAVSKTTYSDLYNIIGDSFASIITGGGIPWQSQCGFNQSTQSDITGWTSTNNLIYTTERTASLVTKNYIYILGGYSNVNGVLNAIQRASFDDNGNLTSGWSNVGTIPIGMFAIGYVATKGRFYLIGGYRFPNGPVQHVYSAPINADGTLGSFRTEISLPSLISHLTCFVIKNKIYIVGGFNGNIFINNVYRVTVNDNGTLSNWEALPNYPIDIVYGKPLIIKDRIYIFGSYNNTSESRIYYAIYDSNGNIGSWTYVANMPNNIYGSAIVCTDNYVFSIGGQIRSNIQNTNAVYRAPILADGSIGSWTQISNGPVAAVHAQSAIVGNKIYFIGGYNDNSGYLNTVYSANFTSGITDYTSYYTDNNSDIFFLPNYYTNALPGENFYIKY